MCEIALCGTSARKPIRFLERLRQLALELGRHQTGVGIQTAAYHDGAWWFGCYGSPPILLKTDTKFRLLGRYEFDCSIGIVGVARDRLLVAKGPRTSKGRCLGSLHLAQPDAKTGLMVLPDS